MSLAPAIEKAPAKEHTAMAWVKSHCWPAAGFAGGYSIPSP